MSEVPSELKYSRTHEWALQEDEDHIVIGITDHAQKLLGDVVFVELPEMGMILDCGKEFGLVESVKAASDLYSPVSGEVVAINEALLSNPALINHSPYGEGWIVKVIPNEYSEWEDLMDAHEYTEMIEQEKE